jgi:putative membrane protein
MHMFYEGGMFMGGWHWLWWLFWVLLLGGLFFYGWGRPSDQRRRSRETPQQVLQRRLASGEITTDDYEKRKALLDRDAAASG